MKTPSQNILAKVFIGLLFAISVVLVLPPDTYAKADGVDRIDEVFLAKSEHTSATAESPGMAVLLAPSHHILDPDPTFSWEEAAGAEEYRLYISGPEGVVYNTWHSAASVCSIGTCSFTGVELEIQIIYTWYIQTRNSSAAGPWSSWRWFKIVGPNPFTPINFITDVTPTYIWGEHTEADNYRLFVTSVVYGTVINEWYSSSEACTGFTCSITNPIHLHAGTHEWILQIKNNDGSLNEWSNWQAFVMRNQEPPSNSIVPTSPNGGDLTSINPTFTWEAVDRASWYKVFIGSQATGKVYNAYHQAADICYGASCLISPTDYLLSGIPVSNLEANTEHNWYVMPLNRGGNGSWSAAQNFITEP